MPRLSRDSRLETRQARSRLRRKAEPYWRQVHPGLFVGYRKGQRGGVWIVRRFVEGRYEKRRLGIADDHQDANGLDVLDYKQAHKAALQRADNAAKTDAGIRFGPYLVEDAMADYLAWYKINRKSYKATESAINTHILPALGSKDVEKLTTRQIRKWLDDLATAPAKRRRTDPDDPDTKRRRQATANRVLTILKAALNHAWREEVVPSRDAWTKVKPYRGADAPKIRYLTHAECTRLLNVCPTDFRQLVRAALLTGCRYGELIRMQCQDYNPDSGTVHVRESKSGKTRHVPLTDEGREFFDRQTAGQKGSALIFAREDKSAWSASHQIRRMLAASEAAKIEPAVSFHVLRHTYGSFLALAGVPLQVIAHALGHADTRMTERHYAHLQPNYVADTVRANLPNFGFTADNVRAI